MRSRLLCFICNSSALLLIAAGAAFGTGCNSARQYNIIAPAASRGEITPNAGAIISRDKIDYEIFQAENKVIVHFVNHTGERLHLTEQSVTFDVGGHSFAIEAQEVAPDESGRVVLPPSIAIDNTTTITMPSDVRVGGVDEGGLIGTRRDREYNDANGSRNGAAAPPPGFRWPANGQARLRLIYRVGSSDAELTHDWTFRRTK